MTRVSIVRANSERRKARHVYLTAKAFGRQLRGRGNFGTDEIFAGSNFIAPNIIKLFPLKTMRTFAPRDLALYSAPSCSVGACPAFRSALKKGDSGLTLHLT